MAAGQETIWPTQRELVARGWVELPACKGGNGEIELAANLENASVANCKSPAPAAMAEMSRATEIEKGWVELPDCTGATGELKLDADLANASKATCKGPATKK